MTTKTTAKRRSLTPLAKAQDHPRSAKLAIAAFCYHQCMSEVRINAHNTKLDIRDCKALSCPLWPHRGWQKLRDRAGSARPSKKEKPPSV